jgi:hypothetical protein
VQSQIIAPVGKTARVVTAFHSKVAGLEDSHNTA